MLAQYTRSIALVGFIRGGNGNVDVSLSLTHMCIYIYICMYMYVFVSAIPQAVIFL